MWRWSTVTSIETVEESYEEMTDLLTWSLPVWLRATNGENKPHVGGVAGDYVDFVLVYIVNRWDSTINIINMSWPDSVIMTKAYVVLF